MGYMSVHADNKRGSRYAGKSIVPKHGGRGLERFLADCCRNFNPNPRTIFDRNGGTHHTPLQYDIFRLLEPLLPKQIAWQLSKAVG